MPPSWSPSLATATRLRWSTVCWTKLPRRVQTISHLLEDPLLCRLLQSPFMQEWKNQFKFRYFARNTVFCRCRVQTISHLLEDALLLPTASITIYAGTKESILISVFRAQNSSSSLTNTNSLFLHWKQSKSTATAHVQYSSNVVMQIFAILNKRILFHPFFFQFLISRNLHRHEQGEKTRIDPLISVLCARGNGSVNCCKFLASVRHDFAGFGYIGADLWNKICVLYYLLKSTTLSTSKFEICQH